MTSINFQKPESGLKRIEELRNVGNDVNALDLCAQIMSNRKFKNNASLSAANSGSTANVLEQICMISFELVVEQKDLKTGRDILINYRSMTQTSNTASLEKVVRSLRTLSEEKVSKSMATAREGSEEVEDLDSIDTPDKALKKALQPKSIRDQERKEREVLENIRFLWDTYKSILDVFKTNGKTEDLYNETACRALTFTKDHKRVNEFKKLCDLLRSNYANLFRRLNSAGAYPSHAVNPLDPDTLRRTIETRTFQLKVAADLQLWKETYSTCEDLHQLLVRVKKPRASILAIYYEFLSKICWKSNSFLFHAYASVRNYTLHKNSHKNLNKDIRRLLADIAILSVMSVDVENVRGSDYQGLLTSGSNAGTGSLSAATDSYSAAQVDQDKKRRMALLFNLSSVPSKGTLKSDLISRDILKDCSESVGNLYRLIEMAPRSLHSSGGSVSGMSSNKAAYYPKELGSLCEPLLKQIESLHASSSTTSTSAAAGPDNTTSTEEKENPLVCYIPQLKKAVFFRLLGQLSKVYSVMTVDQLKQLTAPIVNFATAETWLISSARDSGISVQFDYVQSTVSFGAQAHLNDISNLKQPLVRLAQTTASLLKTELGLQTKFESNSEKMKDLFLGGPSTNPKTGAKVDIGLKTNSLYNLRINQEAADIENRIQAIESRNQERENEIQIQVRKKQESDAQRILDAQKAHELQQANQLRERQKRVELEKAKAMELRKMMDLLDEMKRQWADGNPKIGDFLLQDVTEEQLKEHFTFEKLLEDRDNIIARERGEKIRFRKLESKRCDHLARALREQQLALIPQWSEDTKVAMEELANRTVEKTINDAKHEHKEMLERKKELTECNKLIKVWLDAHTNLKKADNEKIFAERKKKEWIMKCERAMKRHEQAIYEKEQEEERIRFMEEQRKREEIERDRMEKEAEERRIKEEEEMMKQAQQQQQQMAMQQAQHAQQQGNMNPNQQGWRQGPGPNNGMGKGNNTPGDSMSERDGNWRMGGPPMDPNTNSMGKGGSDMMMMKGGPGDFNKGDMGGLMKGGGDVGGMMKGDMMMKGGDMGMMKGGGDFNKGDMGMMKGDFKGDMGMMKGGDMMMKGDMGNNQMMKGQQQSSDKGNNTNSAFDSFDRSQMGQAIQGPPGGAKGGMKPSNNDDDGGGWRSVGPSSNNRNNNSARDDNNSSSKGKNERDFGSLRSGGGGGAMGNGNSNSYNKGKGSGGPGKNQNPMGSPNSMENTQGEGAESGGARPIPQWKKYAMEKKAQENA